jgi:hypothetical protein
MESYKIPKSISQSSEVFEARYFRSENEEYQVILEEVDNEMKNVLYRMQSILSRIKRIDTHLDEYDEDPKDE